MFDQIIRSNALNLGVWPKSLLKVSINWKASKNSVNWLSKFWSSDKTQFRSSEFRSNDPLSWVSTNALFTAIDFLVLLQIQLLDSITYCIQLSSAIFKWCDSVFVQLTNFIYRFISLLQLVITFDSHRLLLIVQTIWNQSRKSNGIKIIKCAKTNSFWQRKYVCMWWNSAEANFEFNYDLNFWKQDLKNLSFSETVM